MKKKLYNNANWRNKGKTTGVKDSINSRMTELAQIQIGLKMKEARAKGQEKVVEIFF